VLELLRRLEKIEQGEEVWLYSGGRTGEGLGACLHEQCDTVMGRARHASNA
jgi:hypothetical protein